MERRRGMGTRKERRTEVQLDRQESWRAKDKRGEGNRGYWVGVGWRRWVGDKKENGLEDLDAGSISIRDLSWYQTGAISDKKSTWKRL